MFKILSTSILLVLLISCNGKPKKFKDSAITKIENGKQIEYLLQTIDLNEYKDFKVDSPIDYFDKSSSDYATRENLKVWYKGDFDNNGFQDLLVSGTKYRARATLCILDNGNDSFSIYKLNWTYWRPDVFVSKIAVGDEDMIEMTKMHNPTKKFISSILTYKDKRFIEYNPSVTKQKIQRIDFGTTSCEGTCPIFGLTINNNRKAIYNAQNFNRDTGVFVSTIGSNIYEEIIALLNYLDFTNLEDYYSNNLTDVPASFLEITYNDGKIKKITDIGQEGTLGLKILYEKLFALRDNQNWVKKEK